MREPKKLKLGFDPSMIVAIVFGMIGIIYLPIGIGLSQIPDGFIFVAVFGGLGLIFLSVALILLSGFFRKKKAIQEAYENGECLQCTITNVYQDRSVRVNHHGMYRLECSWTDPMTGVVHVYRSRMVSYIMDDIVGETVNVYVDPYKPKYYYVDIDEFVPQVVYH